MSPATQRTLYRFLAVFLASGAADALIQFVTSDSYDWRHLVGAIVAAGVLALEKILSEHNDQIASPTVNAMSAAIQANAVVPSPTVAVPEAQVLIPPPKT